MGGKPNANWYGYDHMRNLLRKDVLYGIRTCILRTLEITSILIKHMSKHYCRDQDLAWVLLQDNSY